MELYTSISWFRSSNPIGRLFTLATILPFAESWKAGALIFAAAPSGLFEELFFPQPDNPQKIELTSANDITRRIIPALPGKKFIYFFYLITILCKNQENYSSNCNISPSVVELALISPAGSSTTRQALKYKGVKRFGFNSAIALITRLDLSTNNTSMGKRIKYVCMELHGFKTRPWPGGNALLPKSPFTLGHSLSASLASWAKRKPLLVFFIFIG
jgi:hypothetical protein